MSLAYFGRVELDQGALGPIARVVVHDVERAEPVVDFGEQPLDLLRRRHVAPEGKTADLVRQRRELVRIARGEPHLMPSRASSRANEALMPSPAPTINAALAMLHSPQEGYRTHTRVVGRVKQGKRRVKPAGKQRRARRGG